MLCKRCHSLFRAARPEATRGQAFQKALSSYFPFPTQRRLFAKTTTLCPSTQPLYTYRQPATRRAAFHTSNCLSRPADSPSVESNNASAPQPKLEKPDFLNAAESEIWDRLVNEFDPVELLVQDISGGCGSMYGIEVSSEKFRGSNMLKQQRMVNAVLGDLMKGWHGVQLKTRVP